MVMVKNPSIMTSNIPPILLLLCFFCSVSCASRSSRDAEKKSMPVSIQDASLNSSVRQTVNFVPDSTINGILMLDNSQSSTRFFSKISSKKLINRLRETPVLAFSNKAKEYLLLYQYEGGTRNEFSCFEIGDISDLKKNVTTTTDYKNFETESGLKLGLPFKEMIKIKGKSYTKEGDKIIYRISDYSKSNFLKRYNMPAYFLECTFQNDSISKIKFGFVFP